MDAPKFRGMASLGYAHTEDVLREGDRHARLSADVAAAWVARPWLQLALRLDNRLDWHRSAAGRDSGASGTPTLSSRHAFALPRRFWIAGQARLRFPSAESPGRSFRATTTELAALLSRELFQAGEVTLQLGYRIDRTRHAFGDDLSASDALAASMSRWDAALVGALVSVPMGSVTAVGEASWEPYAGKGAPALRSAPLRLRAALQISVRERLVPGVEVGVNAASRPEPDAYTRIEPRVWAALSLGVVLDPKARESTHAPAPVPPVEPAPVVPSEITLQVLGPDHAPMERAEVVWEHADGREQASTDAEGKAVLNVMPGTDLHLSVRAPEMIAVERRLRVSQAQHALSIELARALPEGEIKGKVRSLRGGPLKARIEVLPGGQVFESASDGTFAFPIAPGDYRVRISAEGYEVQERPAQVELRGVTVLVVDLRRTQ